MCACKTFILHIVVLQLANMSWSSLGNLQMVHPEHQIPEGQPSHHPAWMELEL